MTQSNQGERERRQRQPRQAGRDRNPSGDVRSRRSGDADSASEQQFDPEQFTVSRDGAVRLKVYERPQSIERPLTLLALQTGSTSPTTHVTDGILGLHMQSGKAVYPFWVVPIDADHSKQATLRLHMWAALGTVTASSFTVSIWPLSNNEVVPTTAPHTETFSCVIGTTKENVIKKVPVPLHEGVTSLRIKIECNSVTVTSGGRLELHAMSISYPSRYRHSHSEVR